MKEKVKYIVVGIIAIVVSIIIFISGIVKKINQRELTDYEYTRGAVCNIYEDEEYFSKGSIQILYSIKVSFATQDNQKVTFETGYIFDDTSQFEGELLVGYDPKYPYSSAEVVREDFLTGKIVLFEDADNGTFVIGSVALWLGLLILSFGLTGVPADITCGIGFLQCGIISTVLGIVDERIAITIGLGVLFDIGGIAFLVPTIRDIKKAKKQKQIESSQSNITM